jgi:Flp pilus assembly protein TadG
MTMKKLIAAVCFVFAVSPFALAQDKAKSAEKKAAPAAEKSAKKEPTEKQKAQQARMKACAEQAAEKKLKGDERKKFMSGCMKA